MRNKNMIVRISVIAVVVIVLLSMIYYLYDVIHRYKTPERIVVEQLDTHTKLGNPYVFGKAYESIKIPIDEKLKEYIDLLKRAEKLTLKDASENIVEFDVTVDKYIASL